MIPQLRCLLMQVKKEVRLSHVSKSNHDQDSVVMPTPCASSRDPFF